MADTVILREYLVQLGFRVDESAQRRFTDSIESMSKAVIGLGLGVAGAASAVAAAVANMANSASQMQYLSLTVNDTVSNIDALAFAWQKLGLAPQQTMSALQNLANMMRTQPGFASLWENYAGPGSLTQQFERMGERFARMTQGEQFIFRQQFEKFLGQDVINAWLTRGTQAGAGVQEFNAARRLFHFDPDYFAQQSVQFERAWQSFQLRLSDIMGHGAGSIIDNMTNGLRTMTEWLDAHADQIISQMDRIAAAISAGFNGAVRMVRDIVGWFERLPAEQQQIIAAVAAIMAAFMFPEMSKIAVLIGLLSELFADYQRFQTTGKSLLPWGEIEQGLSTLLKYLGDLNTSLGGLITPLHAIEVYFGARLLFAAGRFFTAVVIGSAAAGTAITTSLGGAITRLLALIPKVGPLAFLLGVGAAGGEDAQFSAQKNDEFTRNHETFGGGGSLSDWIRHQLGYDTDPRFGGTPTGAPQQQGSGPSILERLGHVLSYLNPISVAEGAELPANIKQLTQEMATLNDTLSNANDNGVGGLGSWASGLGAGVVGRLFGGGGSGGQDAAKNINSPEAIEAVKYFMSKGWTLPQAIGIVSNLMQESSLSTTAVDSTGHVGVAQWDQQRQATFRTMFGKPLTAASRHEQYDYVDWELRNTEAKAGFALGQSVSQEQATMAVDRFYERSAGTEIGRRLANARALGSNPNLLNASYTGGNTISQTNNVTINTSHDPNDVGRAWDEYNRRHWADLQRNQQGAFQ